MITMATMTEERIDKVSKRAERLVEIAFAQEIKNGLLTPDKVANIVYSAMNIAKREISEIERHRDSLKNLPHIPQQKSE